MSTPCGAARFTRVGDALDSARKAANVRRPVDLIVSWGDREPVGGATRIDLAVAPP